MISLVLSRNGYNEIELLIEPGTSALCLNAEVLNMGITWI
jgi:hypothetical protein